MSEGKRVSLQSIGPAKKDKKCKSTSTTIRLNLTLPTCKSDTFADFNYNSLILHERKKKEKSRDKDEKGNGGSGIDPYASDDDDNLRRIASSFESKYGTPKKKCRRLEDYTELGTGYDENDSFIDNTDAYDEVVPEDQTPELDGFYINKGELILKRIDGRSSSDQSSSDESDEPQNTKSHKRPLSSESESGSSGSSDSSDGSDDSEDSEEDEEEEEADTEIPKETKPSSKEVREEKSNGHGSSPAAKKPKLLESSSKKVKNKAISGVFLKKAVSEKEHNEKHLKHDLCEIVPSEKRAGLNNIEKPSHLDSDIKQISSIDAAIEAVARGEDSKESGIAESKSHSGSSDESDSDESGNVNGQSNGVLRLAPPLPLDLPSNVVELITALKDFSSKNSNLNKNNFFTEEANLLLLRFEKGMRVVSREKKPGIYDHLEFYLPCRKETLMKRGKALLLECTEKGFKEPLAELKIGIDTLMPSAMERYLSTCKKVESNESPADLTDASKPADKAKVPRRRFPWTEQLKNLFIRAVKKRRIYFATVKEKDQTWEDHLREFLKKDVLPMWENGWMKVVSLMEIINKMCPEALMFKSKQLKACDLTVKIPVCPPKKPLMKADQIPEEVKIESTIKKMSSSPNIAGNSKPQNVNHQIHNAQQASSYEIAVKNEVSLKSSRTTPSVSLMQSSTLPSSNQTSALDLLGSEIAETLRTSLANSLVSVTPVLSSSSQNNQYFSSSSAQSKKSLGSGVDIINLSSNGMDSSIEVVQKKRMSLPTSAIHSGQHNPGVVQSLNTDVQYLNKQQLTSISNVSPTQTTQQSSYHSSSSHNQIKVSSVSAINLKLSGSQSQAPSSHPSSTKASLHQSPSNKANMSQPPSNKASMSQPPSNKANMSQPPSNKMHMSQPPSNKMNMSQPPSNKMSMSQPPSNKINMPPPPSNKMNMPQPPSNKMNMPQPPSNKINMPQPPSTKASMTHHPSSKASMSPSSSNKASLSQSPSNKPCMPQPLPGKANMSLPPTSKANMPPPSSSKANMPHPPSVKSSMQQPLSLKANISQPPLNKVSPSPPLRNNNHQNVSGPQSTSFSTQSVISHGLEPSSLGVSSSLTITPVKPSSSNTYYQQAKASVHSTVQSSTSSIVSHGNSSVRSEVIVTPSISSSMPHIKSTNANFSVSSASASSVSSSNIYANPLAGSNNFSTSISSSVTNFANSRGGGNTYQSPHIIGGNGYPSSLSSSDTSMRTHRTMASDSSTSRNHSTDKIAYSQSSRSQSHDKTSYMSPSMWSSSGPVDASKSPSSSPSSVKSVTPSPEKAMVSRKDRILQESRERPSSEPMMPTLSGPYRSSPSSSDANNAARNLSQAKATPQNLPWDDELFILEDFLKMSSPPSTTPQSTPKVSTTSMDSYKHPLPNLESQRCDNMPNKSLLDSPRPKNLTVPTTTEQQRANVVMHTPYAHNSSKSSSLGYLQHPRDQPRTIISTHAVRDLSRPSSTKSSLNQDSQRANVVMVTPHFQESLRASLKDEMNDILAGIPTQMISRTDHYTITNSMATHNAKRKNLPEMSDMDIDMSINSTASMRNDPKNIGSQEESRQKAHDLAMRGILMSRTNCDGGYVEDNWGAAPMKKIVSNKTNDISDQRLSGMGPLSSSLSMTGLDDMGLGLPSHLLGYQNDYQRHLYGSSSKTTGPNDHRPL